MFKGNTGPIQRYEPILLRESTGNLRDIVNRFLEGAVIHRRAQRLRENAEDGLNRILQGEKSKAVSEDILAHEMSFRLAH